MIKRYYFKIFAILLSFILIFYTNLNNANEILLYADDISYDENENIIARGNAKIFEDNQFVDSHISDSQLCRPGCQIH